MAALREIRGTQAIPCTWNGIEYKSKYAAAKALGITSGAMGQRIKKGYTCDADLKINRANGNGALPDTYDYEQGDTDVVIYALIDPITLNPYYVGQTNHLRRRMWQYDLAGRGDGSNVNNSLFDALKAVYSVAGRIIFEIIDRTTHKDKIWIECYWHDLLTRQGHRLLNRDMHYPSVKRHLKMFADAPFPEASKNARMLSLEGMLEHAQKRIVYLERQLDALSESTGE